MFRIFIPLLTASFLVSGCAVQEQTYYDIPPQPPRTDRLLTPKSADINHLQYGPGYQTFPPIMTKRAAYPTQTQANYAFQRSQWPRYVATKITKEGIKRVAYTMTDLSDTYLSIQIFACRPGALDGVTGRVNPARYHIVVCATDILDKEGDVLTRQPLNFYYSSRAWHIQDPKPSYVAAKWQTREPSPPHSAWFKPFGDRY